MLRRPPSAMRTYPLFPYTTLLRAAAEVVQVAEAVVPAAEQGEVVDQYLDAAGRRCSHDPGSRRGRLAAEQDRSAALHARHAVVLHHVGGGIGLGPLGR